MTNQNQNNAAQAAEQDPLSDEYVNAVIQRHGYQSPETVIARLYQWMGRHGGENGVTLLMYEAHKALVKLRTPVAKPKRAPLDDWRVQAIAECLETEWDDMTPASAEADARLIVGYLIAYEKESDQIEARHAAEPVDPVVQAMRDLRASAPVADESPLAKMAEALREKARQERQDYQDRREADRVASAPVAGEDDHDAK